MMMLKRKIPHPQKAPANKILGLLRRTLEFSRGDFEHTLGTSIGTITSPKTTLIQSSEIELEINRNTAILYAHTIPPH